MAELPLSDAISQYLQAVSSGERVAAAQELSRFARWYGGDRLIADITPGDLERYQEHISTTGSDPAKLMPLRGFFVVAQRRKQLGLDHVEGGEHASTAGPPERGAQCLLPRLLQRSP